MVVALETSQRTVFRTQRQYRSSAGTWTRCGEPEIEVYWRPYLEAGESRRPTLTWPRQIPLDGKPADVVAIVDDFSWWLSVSDFLKLFINADPGTILTGAQREFCRGWPSQREVTVKGFHFIQGDSPAEIGQAIAEWLASLR